jgi:hypothetical protein
LGISFGGVPQETGIPGGAPRVAEVTVAASLCEARR